MQLDQRRFKRVRCELESSFRNLDEPAPPSTNDTLIEDISEGGIRFGTSRFVPVHHRLLFHIEIPHHKSIEAVVQPAWICEIPRLGRFDVGAKFVSLSEEDGGVIRGFSSAARYIP